jgi:hypothetical protein
MVVVPGTITLTSPDADPIVAAAVLLLLHTPPVERSLNKVVSPTHISEAPIIKKGAGFTVTTTVAVQVL